MNEKAEPYLYKADTTDKDGNFTFSFAPSKTETVFLIARYIDKNGQTYQNSYQIDALPKNSATNEIELILSPVYKKNVIKVKIIDRINQREPVAKAEVLLFLNENHAKTYRESEPQGVIQRRTTNERGIAFFSDLEPGTYYVRAKLLTADGVAIAEENYSISTLSAAMSPNDITPFELQVSYPAIKATFLYQDGSGSLEPLAKVQAYLFTSNVQASSVMLTPPAPSGYVDQKEVGASGVVSFTGLTGTNYYLGAVVTLPGNVTVNYVSPVVRPSADVQRFKVN
ncbi:hypothetical protein [Nibrella viscosa]